MRSMKVRGAEATLAATIALILVLLILPLPSAALDHLLAINLALAALILFVALRTKGPRSISAFPSLLLITTLFRLALNVSSTRLILGQGNAGQVIDAFAHWAAGGSLIVGLAVFAILTLIQLLVVSRGGERVAEVSARFALDALPGRQMALDAELNTGAISSREAKEKRAQLQEESRLFGAMDGAMKFVKGDAIAGLAILSVDLIGGLAIGVLEKGMPPDEALQHYGRLTIGDGLVTQIPALILALSAALVVTRISSGQQKTLGESLSLQLFDPAALRIVAAFALLLALLPGLPPLPFLALAILSGLASLYKKKTDATPAIVIYGEKEDLLRAQKATLQESQRLFSALKYLPQTPTFTEEAGPLSLSTGPQTKRRCAPRRLNLALQRQWAARLSPSTTHALMNQWEEDEPQLIDTLRARLDLFSLTKLLRALLSNNTLPPEPLQLAEAIIETPTDLSLEALIEHICATLTPYRLTSWRAHPPRTFRFSERTLLLLEQHPLEIELQQALDEKLSLLPGDALLYAPLKLKPLLNIDLRSATSAPEWIAAEHLNACQKDQLLKDAEVIDLLSDSNTPQP